MSRTRWLTMVQRKGIGLFVFDAGGVGTMRLFRSETRIILTVGEVGDDGSQQGPHEDVVPVMAIIHGT